MGLAFRDSMHIEMIIFRCAGKVQISIVQKDTSVGTIAQVGGVYRVSAALVPGTRAMNAEYKPSLCSLLLFFSLLVPAACVYRQTVVFDL